MSTPEEHDFIISFTSQLAHVISCAYIASPSTGRFLGFSAGSFMDMTRVARLNETMWTELFLQNADYLAAEVESMAERLERIAQRVLRAGDRESLVCAAQREPREQGARGRPAPAGGEAST